MKIMFVCTGNTCRSAMAECILKKLLKEQNIQDVKVTSAGLNVVDNEMNSYARKSLNEIGVKPKKFCPKQLTDKLLKSHNAVICMTVSQKQKLSNYKNIYTISELTGFGNCDVLDPYGQSLEVYIQTAKLLLEMNKKIIDLIKEEFNL